MFLRFVVVEIIAESVSVDFLSSEKFKSALGKEALGWFEVDVTHEGMSHEELALRLARSLHGGEVTREETHALIRHVVDLFIAAAECLYRQSNIRPDHLLNFALAAGVKIYSSKL